MVDERVMVTIPMMKYNDLLEMNGRVKALCDVLLQEGSISTETLLSILDRRYLIKTVQERNERIWDDLKKGVELREVIEDDA